MKEGTDVVETAELRVMLTALDIPKTILDDEMPDLIEEADPNGEGVFTKEALTAIMEEKLRDKETEEELMKRMEIIDKSGSGKISIPELKQILMTLGRKFNDEQVEEFMKTAENGKDGYCNIDKFVKAVCKKKKKKKGKKGKSKKKKK